ncbi:hypothetical protein BGX38DRAFT_1335211 [Terfezia claveryi]|nr:hypothetical protein BGX38DRAFT_1335211 [Terfezia claveryi]
MVHLDYAPIEQSRQLSQHEPSSRPETDEVEGPDSSCSAPDSTSYQPPALYPLPRIVTAHPVIIMNVVGLLLLFLATLLIIRKAAPPINTSEVTTPLLTPLSRSLASWSPSPPPRPPPRSPTLPPLSPPTFRLPRLKLPRL